MLRNLITFTAITLFSAFLSLTSGTVSAQTYDKSHLTRLDHKFTIGFERTVYTVYMPHTVQFSEKTRMAEQKCARLIFRMRLTSKFRIETGLSYRDIDKILKSTNRYNHGIDISQPCRLSVPLTIQYHLQNERRKLHPYFGAGVQYMFGDLPGVTGAGDAGYLNNRSVSNNLKYLNIIFTQGLIYDITPNLQITQSIHILPEYGIRPVGINFGVGYRLK